METIPLTSYGELRKQVGLRGIQKFYHPGAVRSASQLHPGGRIKFIYLG